MGTIGRPPPSPRYELKIEVVSSPSTLRFPGCATGSWMVKPSKAGVWSLVNGSVVRIDAQLVRAFELARASAIEATESRAAWSDRCRRVEVAQREDPEWKGEACLDIDRIGLLEVVYDGTEGSGGVNWHEVCRWNRHHGRHPAVVEVDPLWQRGSARVLDGLRPLPTAPRGSATSRMSAPSTSNVRFSTPN